MNIFQKHSKKGHAKCTSLTQIVNIEENSLTTTLLPQKRRMLSSHEFTSSNYTNILFFKNIVIHSL